MRDELSEVKKPWCASADEHTHAVANYIEGKVVEGCDPREDVISRVSQLKADVGSSESVGLVNHSLLLTTSLDREIGLHNPLLLWSNLRMPDAWVADFEDKSLERIVAELWPPARLF